jgi:hypothetical protein
MFGGEDGQVAFGVEVSGDELQEGEDVLFGESVEFEDFA